MLRNETVQENDNKKWKIYMEDSRTNQSLWQQCVYTFLEFDKEFYEILSTNREN